MDVPKTWRKPDRKRITKITLATSLLPDTYLSVLIDVGTGGGIGGMFSPQNFAMKSCHPKFEMLPTALSVLSQYRITRGVNESGKDSKIYTIQFVREGEGISLNRTGVFDSFYTKKTHLNMNLRERALKRPGSH